jgi:hypothetical protein
MVGRSVGLSVIRPHDEHQPRVRRRARTVSWVLSPLVLIGIGIWFLFNAAVCMGGGASPSALRVCSFSQALPDLLGLFLAVALMWLVLALRAFGRAMAPDAETTDHTSVVRHVRHAYGQLDGEHKSHVLFAVEMAGWVTAVALTTLVYYHFELAFPLGLVVIAGLVVALARLGRRAIRGFRGGRTSRSVQ